MVIEKDGMSFRSVEEKGVLKAPFMYYFKVCVHVIMKCCDVCVGCIKSGVVCVV